MLEGTKKLFPNDYKDFVDAMIEAAEEDELPIMLELKDPERFTWKDFKDMMYEFKRDTSLDITCNFFLCNDCGQMHLFVEVDFPDEEPPKYLN